MGSRKLWNACSTCRLRKVKCDDGRPCIQCKTKHLQCDNLVGRSTELAHTDRWTSTNSYTYFFYLIRQRNSILHGFGYELGDGNLIVEPNVLPVLRKAMPMLKRGEEQRICRGSLTIEILLSETRQSAELSMLQGGLVCITAEFFGEAPGQKVEVSLRKIADGTTRELGPATWIGSTRWCVVIDHNDLIGHAAIFTRRQGEEVVSVPVPPEPNKSPSPFHESTSSSVAVGSAVGSSQAELEHTAWMYTVGYGVPAQKDILIKYNSVYYTFKTYYALRSRLLTLVEQQAEEREQSGQLSITPYPVRICTEKYIKNQLYLEANFSNDVSNCSISIKAYSPGQRGAPIDAQQQKQASQCSVSIDPHDYQGNIIVFNCDDEYIVSFPVKRCWVPNCDYKLYEMKEMGKDDLYIYNFFSPYVTSRINEDLEWYSQPRCRPGFTTRQEKISELVRSGTEVHWREDRQGLGEAFRGMTFKTFKKMWSVECSSQSQHPALHFD